MVLPWSCHQGLFNDSIIHSWYIFSVVLLPLPPPLNASCCRVALLFSPFCAQWSSFLTDSEKSDWLQRDLGLFCCSLSKCTMSCFSKSIRNSWSLTSPSMAIFAGCIASYFCRDLAAEVPNSQGAQWASATSLCLGWKVAPARTCCNCFHSWRLFKLTSRKLLSTEHLFYLKV